MTRARHSRWAEILFLPYILRQFRTHFHGIHFLRVLPDLDPDLPLLITPNHSTWWDGFFLYILNQKLLNRKLHLMMLEQQLSKYRFFSRIGAFGIEPGLPRRSFQALQYSAEVLQNPQHALCIFPQGMLRYSGIRPLGFQRGIGQVLKLYNGDLNLLPLGIHCTFLEDQRPEVLFMADTVFRVNYKNFEGIEWLERQVELLLDRLQSAILKEEKMLPLVRGKETINKRWDTLRRKKG